MPFDLLDPITADAPARNFSMEEDYELLKANVADCMVERPAVELSDGSMTGCDLIILHSTLGECLASSLVDLDAPLAGRITSSDAGARASSTSFRNKSMLDGKIYKTDDGVNVIVADVAPERAVAWSSEVFRVLRPTSVFVVCGMAGFNFRGTIDAESTTHNIFFLHTNKHVPNCQPLLPNANILGGIGAAVMLQAECEGLPGSAVIAVELTQIPEEGLVCGLGNALLSLLGNGPLAPDQMAKVKKACANKYAASADLSVYV